MPQLHLYLPKEIANEVKRRARAKRLSVSKYLGELVQSRLTDDWPTEFFARVVGGWQGAPLKRPAQLEFETRDEI